MGKLSELSDRIDWTLEEIQRIQSEKNELQDKIGKAETIEKQTLIKEAKGHYERKCYRDDAGLDYQEEWVETKPAVYKTEYERRPLVDDDWARNRVESYNIQINSLIKEYDALCNQYNSIKQNREQKRITDREITINLKISIDPENIGGLEAKIKEEVLKQLKKQNLLNNEEQQPL